MKFPIIPLKQLFSLVITISGRKEKSLSPAINFTPSPHCLALLAGTDKILIVCDRIPSQLSFSTFHPPPTKMTNSFLIQSHPLLTFPHPSFISSPQTPTYSYSIRFPTQRHPLHHNRVFRFSLRSRLSSLVDPLHPV